MLPAHAPAVSLARALASPVYDAAQICQSCNDLHGCTTGTLLHNAFGSQSHLCLKVLVLIRCSTLVLYDC